MDAIGQRITATRRSKGLTQKAVARKLGITQSYMSYLEKGTRRLDVDLLQGIAKSLKVAPEFLLTGRARSGKSLRAAGRIPVLGCVPAGLFRFLEDGQEPLGLSQVEEYFADDSIDDPSAFAAIVSGDSMTPRFNDGDRVIFSPEADVLDGDFVLAKIDTNHGTFKQIFFEPGRTIRLAPINLEYEPILTDSHSLRACYKLIRRIERFS